MGTFNARWKDKLLDWVMISYRQQGFIELMKFMGELITYLVEHHIGEDD